MVETPMQRCLRLARENGYYGRLPDPDKKVDFVVQPRFSKEIRREMRELLIQADDRLTDLGLDLMHKWEKMTGDSLGWDPDAYYTPLENVLHHIAELFLWDYNRDIAAEAYRRRREDADA